MADVARLAGVSIATVSHVLNGTRAVRPQTRALVLDAVRAADYTPNTVAQALATARTTTIGLALPAISNPFLGELIHAIEAESARQGYTLLLVDPHEDPEYEDTVIRRLHGRRVDGVLFAPSAQPDAALGFLTAQGVPTVLVDRLIDDRMDQVGSENVEAVAGLVGHLAKGGHTRIALVAGHPGLRTTVERVAGYRLGLQRAGIGVELLVDGHSAEEPARVAVHALLARTDPPTAVITANNSMTIGAMQAFREAGVHVPDDVALACFDDFPWADLFAPRLTVVAQPFAEIGREAVRLLLRRMGDPTAAPQTIRLAPRFVHRDSCGCERR
ncbi:LacI family DNA-binding transcriptional regulator [Pseudonocardia pini]|uniref:LacI family DNA-binding transcriptional regulator n=1 Tax=Pseudonocardia pini TaxID=2758030 RepID=UPI001C68CDC6|nr:LacI family DNA-binding transcriptional regulator [Pseudonocardia pini]